MPTCMLQQKMSKGTGGARSTSHDQILTSWKVRSTHIWRRWQFTALRRPGYRQQTRADFWKI